MSATHTYQLSGTSVVGRPTSRRRLTAVRAIASVMAVSA